jgi:opacity protein-like surface antigen
MRNLLNHWITKTSLALGLSFAATGIACGQAVVTATRGAEITPFAFTTLVSPDYGQPRNLGYTFGVDYTRITGGFIQPSLELRLTNAPGKDVGEHSYLGGFKLTGPPIHGVHVYATLLAGTGGITFMNPIETYGSDTSFVYSMGGGAEFNIQQQWKIRADYTSQHWDLDPQILTPAIYSVGISYSIPFHGNGGWVH